jgi:hypothetical protein
MFFLWTKVQGFKGAWIQMLIVVPPFAGLGRGRGIREIYSDMTWLKLSLSKGA